jgi:acyl-CoA thioester hydrolase
MESSERPLIHEYKILIRESHLDTFGHVNNATYLVLFEEARWDLITKHGYGLDKIQSSGIGPTILEVKLQFRRELLNRDEITIRTYVTEIRSKIQSLRQVMVNSRSEEACIADFTFALFDMQRRKLIDPTPEWLATFKTDL